MKKKVNIIINNTLYYKEIDVLGMRLYKFKIEFITFLLLIAIFSSCSASSASASAWRLRHSEKGINLYSQKSGNSDYLQVKANVIFNVAFSDLLAQFNNDDKCWKWIKKCKIVKLLTQISDDEKIIYSVLNMPWPLSKRDFVFRSVRKIEILKGCATLELSPVNGVYKSTKYIRAKSTITYRIKSLSTTSSSLSIVMHSELGGTTPTSLINSLIVGDLIGDIKELKKSIILNSERNFVT